MFMVEDVETFKERIDQDVEKFEKGMSLTYPALMHRFKIKFHNDEISEQDHQILSTEIVSVDLSDSEIKLVIQADIRMQAFGVFKNKIYEMPTRFEIFILDGNNNHFSSLVGDCVFTGYSLGFDYAVGNFVNIVCTGSVLTGVDIVSQV